MRFAAVCVRVSQRVSIIDLSFECGYDIDNIDFCDMPTIRLLLFDNVSVVVYSVQILWFCWIALK